MRSIRTTAVLGTTALMMFLLAGTASASPPSPSAPRVDAWLQPLGPTPSLWTRVVDYAADASVAV